MLLAFALSVTCLVCAVIVLVKAFRHDQAVLAVLGLFFPLVLFVVGWVKAREWQLTRTMLAWTLSAVLMPVLVVGAAVGVFGVGLLAYGQLSPETVAVDARPDPGTLEGFRGQPGQVLEFEVRGRTTGTVYGTDVYTDDSDLATAAVHSGALGDGEVGVVRVTLLGGQEGYAASTHNGVTSHSWGGWLASYRVEAAPVAVRPVATAD
jgi:hypothetical protein